MRVDFLSENNFYFPVMILLFKSKFIILSLLSFFISDSLMLLKKKLVSLLLRTNIFFNLALNSRFFSSKQLSPSLTVFHLGKNNNFLPFSC